MRLLSTSILISLASLLLNSVTALSTDKSLVIEEANSTNSTLSSLHPRGIYKQTRCFKEGALFDYEDLRAYAEQLETNDFDKLIFVPHGRYINGVFGTLKVCAYNPYDIEGTSIMNAAVASALYKILDKCCEPTEFLCRGGYAQEFGEPHLFIDFVTRTHGETCNKPYDGLV